MGIKFANEIANELNLKLFETIGTYPASSLNMQELCRIIIRLYVEAVPISKKRYVWQDLTEIQHIVFNLCFTKFLSHFNI